LIGHGHHDKGLTGSLYPWRQEEISLRRWRPRGIAIWRTPSAAQKDRVEQHA
jgi:hypothetical protein